MSLNPVKTTCRICGAPLVAPRRVFDDRGNVVSGCVASDHDGHLTALTASARWHNRKDAKQIRRSNREFWK